MTVLYVKGTTLAEKGISKPMVKPFLISLGILFLLTMHYFQHNPGGAGLELSFNTLSWIPFGFAITFGLLEIFRQQVWRYSRLTLVLFVCCVLLTLPVFYPQAVAAEALPRLAGLWLGGCSLWLTTVLVHSYPTPTVIVVDFGRRLAPNPIWLGAVFAA